MPIKVRVLILLMKSNQPYHKNEYYFYFFKN